MFVGHAALAFAICGLGARAFGFSRERALSIAVVAAVAATIPDLDMLSVLPALLSGPAGSLGPVESFWDGAAAHRSLTHSLVVAIPIGAIVGLVAGAGRRRMAGLGLAFVTGGLLLTLPAGTSLVILPVVLSAVGLGYLADWLDVSWRVSWLVATVALLSHPFGDLVTGDPPWLLYPAGLDVLTGRVTLAADPTLHLLAAFFLELGAIWLGLYTIARLHDRSLGAHIRPRAAFGGLFAFAALVLPAPTLAESYQFVFGVLAVGAIGVRPRDRRVPLAWITTGLTAITVAALAFTATYFFGIV